LHLDLDCLANAERRRAFPRALRVPGPLAVDHVREHLEQHVKKAAGSSRGEQE
jgi:hypothetical protein